MKKLIFILLASFSIQLSYAQKVKIKKDLAYVDGQEYLIVKGRKTEYTTIQSLQGKDLIMLQDRTYQKPNPHPMDPKYRATYSAYLTVFYSVVKFLDFELEFETSQSTTEFVQALYQDGVISPEGTVVEEKAKLLQKKYGKDISGTIPQIASPSNTVIIQQPAPSNGVNISIGR